MHCKCTNNLSSIVKTDTFTSTFKSCRIIFNISDEFEKFHFNHWPSLHGNSMFTINSPAINSMFLHARLQSNLCFEWSFLLKSVLLQMCKTKEYTSLYKIHWTLFWLWLNHNNYDSIVYALISNIFFHSFIEMCKIKCKLANKYLKKWCL